MALATSGALSMGGSTADRSINCELGLSGTAQISLNDAAVRGLAGVPSGAISIDDFYGASAGPSTFGEVFEGGYYMGTIVAASSSYFLMMAPNATGCAFCAWKTSRTCSNVGSDANARVNGFCITYECLANASHPAGNWTATRSINAFSDWYLPALCELNQLFTNRGSSPAGQAFASFFYWSSTEANALAPYYQNMNTGSISGYYRDVPYRIRAIRRVAF